MLIGQSGRNLIRRPSCVRSASQRASPSQDLALQRRPLSGGATIGPPAGVTNASSSKRNANAPSLSAGPTHGANTTEWPGAATSACGSFGANIVKRSAGIGAVTGTTTAGGVAAIATMTTTID